MLCCNEIPGHKLIIHISINPLQVESEFPEAGTVWRQAKELERRDSQKREQQQAARSKKRDSQKGSRSSVTEEQQQQQQTVGSSEGTLSDDSAKSVESVEVETLVKISARKSPSRSPNVATGSQGQSAGDQGQREGQGQQDPVWPVSLPVTTGSESATEERLTPSGAQSAYPDENITWSVGTVKQHKELIESKVQDVDLTITKKEVARPQHLDVTSPDSCVNNMDPLSRPRSPNIHSIEIKSVAIPKEGSSKSLFKSEGGKVMTSNSESDKPKSSPEAPVQMIERKIIIEEKLESLPKSASEIQVKETQGNNKGQNTSSSDSSTTTSSSDSDTDTKKGTAWDDVKVRELVGIFESKDETGSNSRSSSLTNAPEIGGMAELGLTFQSSKTSDKTQQARGGQDSVECKIKSKRHTWTAGDKTGKDSTGSAAKSHKRYSCKETKHLTSQKDTKLQESSKSVAYKSSHSISERDSSKIDKSADSEKVLNVKSADKSAESKGAQKSSSSTVGQTKGKGTSATSRTRTVPELPEKAVKGQGQTKITEESERKSSLPAKVKGSSDTTVKGESVDSKKDETANVSLLRRPKSADHSDGGAVRSVSAYELKSVHHPPSPLASPSDGSTSPGSATSPGSGGSPAGRPTGLNPVPINSQREPDATRRVRKQHGKTHPLARLTAGQDGAGGKDSQSGRSANPFYNTM